MRTWKTIAAGAAFGIALAVGHTVSMAQETVWQAGSVLPGAFWSVKDLSEEAAIWEKESNGKLKVNVLPAASSGVQGPDMLSAASENLLQVSEVFGSNVAGQARILEMLDLPFFVPDDPDFRIELAAKLFDDYARIFEERFGVWMLGMQQLSPRTLYTKQVIAKLDDVKGLKVRAIGPVDSDFTRAMGMAATTTNWGEVYTTIQQGTIDGVWTSDPGALSMKFYEVAPNAYNTGNAGPSFFVVINKDALAGIPEDLRKFIMGRRDEFQKRRFALQRQVRGQIRAGLENAGAKFSEPSAGDKAAMEKMAEPIIAQWANKLDAEDRKLFDKTKALIDEYKASRK